MTIVLNHQSGDGKTALEAWRKDMESLGDRGVPDWAIEQALNGLVKLVFGEDGRFVGITPVEDEWARYALSYE